MTGAGRPPQAVPLLAVVATVVLLSLVDGWLGAVLVVSALVAILTVGLRRAGARRAPGAPVVVFTGALLLASVTGELVARGRAWEPLATLAVAAAALVVARLAAG